MRQKGQSGRALPSLSSQAVVRTATRDGTTAFCNIISFAEVAVTALLERARGQLAPTHHSAPGTLLAAYRIDA